MQKIIVIVSFIYFMLYPLVFIGQEEEFNYILESDSTWQKELFTFPIRFAPQIKYIGTEDARFPEGWNDIKSPAFWSYAFAWDIEITSAPTERELEINLQHYFNGLMGLQIKDNDNETSGTVVLILKEDSRKSRATYRGKITTFDAFFTKKNNKPTCIDHLLLLCAQTAIYSFISVFSKTF